MFQLRHTPLRFRVFLAVAPADSCVPVVSAAILYASVLHQLQHQLPSLLRVWHHFPTMYASTHTQEAEELVPLPLQSPAVHLDVLKGNNYHEMVVAYFTELFLQNLRLKSKYAPPAESG